MQVKVQLQGTHTQSVWSAQEPEGSVSLPSFNAYPQLSVTAAGEYLMMLPQLLESLLTDSEEGTDTEWLDKVNCMCLHSHNMCFAVQDCAVLCCAVLCCAVLCCAVLGWAELCCAAACRAVLCCDLLCYGMSCRAVLCCAVLCCAVLCCGRTLCCTTSRPTILITEEHVLILHQICLTQGCSH